MTKHITLLEALIGTNFEITHLDKTKFTVSTLPNDVLQDGCKKIVKNKGMPFFKDPMSRGNLIIEFKVDFPTGE